MSEGYNGYANYETWAVGLWIDNDEYHYANILEMAQTHEGNAYTLATDLKDYVDQMPDIEAARNDASLAADLLGAALSEVDWYELAEGWLQTAKEAQEYADK